MPTTKTPPNAVRTSNCRHTFYLERLLFRGESRGDNNYFMTKVEMRLTLLYAFERHGDNARPVVYLSDRVKYEYDIETNGDTRRDYFAIGCMKFSRNATVKIAEWCGLSRNWIENYLTEVIG